MRTYILALTKYGITALVVVYTILAFAVLFQKRRSMLQLLSFLQAVCLFLFQLLSYFTLWIALRDVGYLFFCAIQLVVFLAAAVMYRALYPRAYMPLFNNMCMMLSIGLVILSRLGFDQAIKQFIIATGSLVLAVVLPMLRGSFYMLKKPKYLYAFAGIVMLAIVMMMGATTLGAQITWTIAGLTFQPSEFVKILYLLFLASTLKDAQSLRDVFVVAVFAAAHVLVLIGSTDLGGGLIFYIVFLFVVYYATHKGYFLAGGFGAAALAAVVLYHRFSHIRQRVQAFLDPWSLIDSIGYQVTQSLFAISAGGMFGSGLGQGSPEKIPFAESDFIFASLSEEFGMIVGICVIALCLNCFLMMMSLSMKFADKFYRLLAYGIGILYGAQSFLTLGGETKFIPLTGVTLPFISYGGSSILSMTILFTIVQIMYMLRGEKIDEYREKRNLQLRRRTAREQAIDERDRYGHRYRETDRMTIDNYY